jgi:membrane protein required for colicin V production
MLAELNIVDWGIMALLLVSMLTSLLRGFVREALSLAVWALAFLLATMFYPRLQILLVDVITHPLLQQVAAFLALFLAALVVGSLVANLIGQLISLTGLGFVDRLLGMVFGLVRGVVIALAIAMVMDMSLQTADARPAWFVESQLIPQLLLLQDWARDTTATVLSWLTDVVA